MQAVFSSLRHLSIDIVFGAVILLRFFSTQMGVSISLPTYLALGVTVWLIYTMDHLSDARKARPPIRDRYVFHLRYQTNLKRVMIVTVLVMVLLLFFVEIVIIVFGAILAGLSLVYLMIQPRLAKRGLKEFYVAVIYTTGILLAPFALLGTFEWVLWLKLFILAYLNLLLFSTFEKADDMRDQFHSIATVLEPSAVEKVILLLLAIGMFLVVLSPTGVVNLYFFIGFVIYTVLFVEKGWSKKKENYRLMGDWVFVLPVLFEWL